MKQEEQITDRQVVITVMIIAGVLGTLYSLAHLLFGDLAGADRALSDAMFFIVGVGFGVLMTILRVRITYTGRRKKINMNETRDEQKN